MKGSRAPAVLLLLSLLFVSACVPSPGKLSGANDGATDSVDPPDTSPDSVREDTTLPDGTSGEETVEPRDALGDTQPADGADGSSEDALSPDDASSDTTGGDLDPLDAKDASVDAFDPILLQGRLGPAPAGTFSKVCDLEVRNDRKIAREREIAYSAIPVAREDNLTTTQNLVVVDDQGQWVQAQFRVLSRWGGALADPADGSRPIRWLEVALTVSVDGNQSKTFELRRYDTAPTAVDPLAIQLEQTSETITIDNGVASYRLNTRNPALIEEIRLRLPAGGEKTVYQHGAGSGPRLVLKDGTLLETAATYGDGTQSDVIVDVDPNSGKPQVEIVDAGPLRIQLLVRGHFVSNHPDAFGVCDDGDFAAPRHRFAFSAVLTITRGHPAVHLRYNLRNECGKGVMEWLTDDAITIGGSSWEFTLTAENETHFFSGILDEPVMQSGDPSPRILVEQQPGSDSSGTWLRRARVIEHLGEPGQNQLQSGTTLETPLVGIQRGEIVALLQMPWMRYREPQGLESSPHRLSAKFVSSTLRLGEAKAIWGEALLRFAFSSTSGQLKSLRDRGQAQLERGLLIRLPLEQFNRTKVYPPLGRSTVTGTTLKQKYLVGITGAHNTTLGYPVHPSPAEPGQWARFFVYGSQLWPDTPENSWTAPSHKNPFDYRPTASSGSPISVELLEFYRSGEPKWVWDFALPLARLMIFSAAYNKGRQPSAFNGIVPVDDGSGEGDWHRKADQYSWERATTFNDGLRDAYLVRPDPLFVERFRVAATTSALLFPGLELSRSWFQAVEFYEANTTDPASGIQLFQVIESLLNCAELVPGDESKVCLQEAERLLGELRSDNLTSGLPCDGESKPPDEGTCNVRFLEVVLWNALPTLHRYVTTFAVDPAPWKQALVALAKQAVKNVVQTVGANLTTSGFWPLGLTCTISAGKAVDCTADTSINLDVPSPYFPGIVGFIAAVRSWDATVIDCATLKSWYSTPNLYDSFQNETAGKYGYDTYAALALRHVVYGIGALDQCP